MAGLLVTENWLRLNRTPKGGITPGTDDTLIMGRAQILARYNVTISLAGDNRCPDRDECVAVSAGVYFYGVGSFVYTVPAGVSTVTIWACGGGGAPGTGGGASSYATVAGTTYTAGGGGSPTGGVVSGSGFDFSASGGPGSSASYGQGGGFFNGTPTSAGGCGITYLNSGSRPGDGGGGARSGQGDGGAYGGGAYMGTGYYGGIARTTPLTLDAFLTLITAAGGGTGKLNTYPGRSGYGNQDGFRWPDSGDQGYAGGGAGAVITVNGVSQNVSGGASGRNNPSTKNGPSVTYSGSPGGGACFGAGGGSGVYSSSWAPGGGGGIGGGGAGCGIAGGGAGARWRKAFSVSAGQTINITVGAGGKNTSYGGTPANCANIVSAVDPSTTVTIGSGGNGLVILREN